MERGDSDWEINGNVDNVEGRDVNGAGRTIAGNAKWVGIMAAVTGPHNGDPFVGVLLLLII
jgi:hypothetical protein